MPLTVLDKTTIGMNAGYGATMIFAPDAMNKVYMPKLEGNKAANCIGRIAGALLVGNAGVTLSAKDADSKTKKNLSFVQAPWQPLNCSLIFQAHICQKTIM